MLIEVGPNEPIGDLIRRIRNANSQTQQQLAEQLNKLSGRDTVTGHEVSRWESHERIPRPYSRRWIAEALGIDQLLLDRAAAVAADMRRSKSARLAPSTSLPSNDTYSANAFTEGMTPAPTSKKLEEVLVGMLNSTVTLIPDSTGGITIEVTNNLAAQLRDWAHLTPFGTWELLPNHTKPVDPMPPDSTWLRVRVADSGAA